MKRYVQACDQEIEKLLDGPEPQVKLYKIAGEYQPADIFKKGLPKVAFERHRPTLMGESPLVVTALT